MGVALGLIISDVLSHWQHGITVCHFSQDGLLLDAYMDGTTPQGSGGVFLDVLTMCVPAGHEEWACGTLLSNRSRCPVSYSRTPLPDGNFTLE
jgi:hypothetical protein